jgi:hypothetical protein
MGASLNPPTHRFFLSSDSSNPPKCDVGLTSERLDDVVMEKIRTVASAASERAVKQGIYRDTFVVHNHGAISGYHWAWRRFQTCLVEMGHDTALVSIDPVRVTDSTPIVRFSYTLAPTTDLRFGASED